MRRPRTTLTTSRKIVLARLCQRVVMAARTAVGKGPEVEAVRRQVCWRLDLREGIDFAIFLLGAFEPSTMRAYTRLLKPGDVAVDIGANVGAHTLHLARAVGEKGLVVAFEPTDYAFGKLAANVSLNPVLAPRIRLHQVMLGDREGAAPRQAVYASWPLGPDRYALHREHGGRSMPTGRASATTLDRALEEARVDRVDLVKMDVDGFECEVVRGARETLRRRRPVIVMELAPYVLDEQGGSVEELLALLADAEYEIADMATGRPISGDGAGMRAMIPVGASRNVIARPRLANA